MGYKAAVQVLKQAEKLKAKVSGKFDWLNSNEVWTDQQKLQNLYHQVLVLDLEYALDKKVEQDLWNTGFKNHISSLQELVRNKKNPLRSDYQALLTWALESASGFYITLLQELCNTFDIDLPFRRRGNVFGQSIQCTESVDLPQTSSCLYICQYCLVHLGDISRYRNQRKQAESFYKQAILVSPSSGHPYNQLALLEASQGNKLSTVFYYIRSIAVKNPFLASVTNLSSTLISAINKDSTSEKIPTKMTVNEFIQLFLCTHGYFHTATELKQAELAVTGLNSIMTALVATQGFTGEMLLKITIINLFAMTHADSDKTKSCESIEDKQKVEQLAKQLIAGSLCAYLVPIHTLKVDETLLDYYALPAVKIMLYFIKNQPDILNDKAFSDHLLIWPSLVKLVNSIQKYLKGFNFTKYSKYPLLEDRSLQGFLPLSKNFEDFDFNEEIDDTKIEKLLRLKRISEIAFWLTEIDVNGNKLIVKTENNGEINLEPRCTQPDPTNELLEEMKSFNIESSFIVSSKSTERKAGILKPQGSLEKSREERETLSSTVTNQGTADTVVGNAKVDLVRIKRGKQNVALQSIFKKMEESNKQVKFIDEEVDKEKVEKAPVPPLQQPAQPSNTQKQPFNIPLRTHSFNKNHPAFPMPPPSAQPDYLMSLRGQTEKAVNYQFPKTDVPPPNFMPTYHSNQNKAIINLNQKPPNFQHNIPVANIYNTGSQMPGTFPNMQFSPPRDHWKRDEIPPPVPNTWWQNTSQPPPQNTNYRHNYTQNFPMYPNNVMPPPMMQQNKNLAGGDVFNMPWSNYGNSYISESNNANMNSNKQNMSIRQAMLKEANVPHPQLVMANEGPMGRFSNIPHQESNFLQNSTHAPGYSLFNASSWTPNLAGQLINNKQPENNSLLSQPSLFNENTPKSLAQLLEHQQNQMSKGDS